MGKMDRQIYEIPLTSTKETLISPLDSLSFGLVID